MKFLSNIYVALLTFIISSTLLTFSIFNFYIGKVSNDTTIKTIEIKPGSIDTIGTTLKEEGLIKNKTAFKIYIKLTGKTNLKAATYKLSENMGVKEIVKILESNNGTNNQEITITFKEGINVRKFAKIIAESTNNKEEDIINKIKDKEYLNILINKYWFLTDEILNDNIYYPLEGYLYPNTYYFSSNNVTIEEIIEKLLNETEKKLTPHKDKIQNNNMSLHKVLTLASLVELEGVNESDRKNIASVFINRLNINMSLGSDVTTYYGAGIDMGERDLTSAELNQCNNYNTRCLTFQGLPISPIANPSLESILAVLEPESTNYYYFVADKNKKVYFSKNLEEHNNTIYRLKINDLWYEY